MGQYSIKDLEQLSGIKAHTIRIWEQRYNMFTPDRSESNIRSYSGKDLKNLLNITLLKNNGFKISKVAKMPEEEIQNKVIELSQHPHDYADQVQALTVAMLDVDEDRFEKVMSSCILKLGFEDTMLKVIHPFLSNIGVLWLTGSIHPGQEHFITNLIRQKLIVAIDSQYVSTTADSKKYLLFLPENELHEMSLLFAHFIIRSRNHQSIYLGQSLPMADVKKIHDFHQPNYIITISTTWPAQNHVQQYVDELGNTFSSSDILLSGRQIIAQDINIKDHMHIFNSPIDLINHVNAHSNNSV